VVARIIHKAIDVHRMFHSQLKLKEYSNYHTKQKRCNVT
jgi:hypothetical protein